jgi:putative two-component system response regulator
MNRMDASTLFPDNLATCLQRLMLAQAQSPDLDRVAELLHQVSRIEGDDAASFIQTAIGVCQQLHEQARTFDALPIARVLPVLAERQRDMQLRWRSANAAGIVFGYTGDFESAIAQHGAAIRLAEQTGNDLDQARSWNNLGNVFKYAAAHEYAIECLSRAYSFANLGRVFPRHCALANLAHCHLHLDNFESGRAIAKLALGQETAEFRARDPQLSVVLRSDLVRLLSTSGQFGEISELIGEAAQISSKYPAPIMSIALATMNAVSQIAQGHVQDGLRQLSTALDEARRIPTACIDSLVALVQAETHSGDPRRANVYLYELSDHIYRHAQQNAESHLRIATAFQNEPASAENRLFRKIRQHPPPWGGMPEWDTFEMIAYSASLAAHGDGWHGIRVGEFTRMLALECGYAEDFATELGVAARVHDIGHIGVPDTLHNKRGKLAENESALMQRHTQFGRDLLDCDRHPRALMASHIAHYHHERWNSGGYPAGLRDDGIPRVARMTAIADAFDDMITPRFYRSTLPVAQACALLKAGDGTHFEPALVQAFLKSVNEGLIGQKLREPGWLSSLCPANLKDLMDRVSRP